MDRRSIAVTSLALTLTLAMALPVGALAKGRPLAESSNNLSVPAIMVANVFTGVVVGAEGAPSGLSVPSGPPSTGWEIDSAYYYVQRVNTWQAQAYTYDPLAATKTGTAKWGDNLSGDAKLKVGSPIRVELGLFDDTDVSLQGYTVVKLQPSKLDRESAYGTLAEPGDPAGTWQAIPTTFGIGNPVRIYDSAVTFSIKMVDGDYVVQPGSNPTAEINAGGAITYGYNLRVGTAGEYDITFTIPNVDITGVSAGTPVTSPTAADTVTLRINVIAGGGGGGGKPTRP